MKVEPIGVIFDGICSIQTEKCVAKQSAPITAVWQHPGRIQVNVCRPCLEEQIRSGEWEIEGAKVEKRADVAVFSPDKKIQLVVEVKKSPSQKKELREWATKIRRNLLVHSGIPSTRYFLLAVLPDWLFLWKPQATFNLDKAPDYELKAQEILKKYLDEISSTKPIPSEYDYEYLVSLWLQELAKSKPSESPSLNWFYESGLYDAVKDGSVVMEATVP
jgi:hypothetical protein